MLTRDEQSNLAKSENDNSIRIQKAQNGYILKTKAGPLVFVDLNDAFKWIEKFFNQKESKK